MPMGHQRLGDLDGVQGGALAQVVAADEEGQAVAGGVRPGGSGPPATGRCRRRAAAWAARPARRPGRRPAELTAWSGLSGRSNSATMASECPVNTGTRTQVQVTWRPGMSRIFRLSSRNFRSSLESPVPSSSGEPAMGDHVVGDDLGEDHRRRIVGGRPVEGQCGGPVDRLGQLLLELGRAGQAGSGHRLVGRDDEAAQPGCVMQRLEHGHGHHGGAVGVGHDALAHGVRGPRR